MTARHPRSRESRDIYEDGIFDGALLAIAAVCVIQIVALSVWFWLI